MRFLACILIMSFILMCGCEADTKIEESESTVDDESTENATLMGYSDYEITREEADLDFYVWTYTNSDGIVLGDYFGFNGDEPETYIVDIDDDGVTELISNCQYGGDGFYRVFVYRNNGGVIECGTYDMEQYGASHGINVEDHVLYSTVYDSVGKVVNLTVYWNGEATEYEVGFDEFSFTEFNPEEI